MANSRQSGLQKIMRGCSLVLVVVGAAVFLLGGKFLHEIERLDFGVSEAYGISAGLLLVALGAGISVTDKRSEGRVAARKLPVETEAEDLRIRTKGKTRRELAAKGFGGLYSRLQEVFYKYDPLLVGQTTSAKDEYGSPVSTIIPRLTQCSGVEELRYIIEEEMSRHYPEYDCNSTQINCIADECWKEWTRFQQANQ